MTISASEQLPLFGDSFNMTDLLQANVWGGRSGVEGSETEVFKNVANVGELFIFRGQIWRCTTGGAIGSGDIGTPPSPTGAARFAQISPNAGFSGVNNDAGVEDLTDINNAATSQFRYTGDLLTGTVGDLVSDGYRVFQILNTPILISGSTNYYAALENTFYFRFVRFANRYRLFGGSAGKLSNSGNMYVTYTLSAAIRGAWDVDQISGFGLVNVTRVRLRRYSSSDTLREDQTFDDPGNTFTYEPTNANEANGDYWRIDFVGTNIEVRQLVVGQDAISIPEPYRLRGGTTFDGQDRSQTAGNLIGILQERVSCAMRFTPPSRAENIWRELGSVQGKFLSWNLDGLLISGNLEVWRTRDTDGIGELDISIHGRNTD